MKIANIFSTIAFVAGMAIMPTCWGVYVHNMSPWGTDNGVYLQCGGGPIIKVADRLEPYRGDVNSNAIGCGTSQNGIVYIGTLGQYFMFANVPNTDSLLISSEGGKLAVNKVAYTKSGDAQLPISPQPTNITITNKSWFGTDMGVYMRCKDSSDVITLAGRINPTTGTAQASYMGCADPVTIYIGTVGQFFTFTNVNASKGLTISLVGNGALAVNGTAYSKSGDTTIPGMTPALTAVVNVDAFKDALAEIKNYATLFANEPKATRLQKLIELQRVTDKHMGIPALKTLLANIASSAQTQLKDIISSDAISTLSDILTDVSQALDILSLKANDIIILQTVGNSPAIDKVQKALDSLAQYKDIATQLDTTFGKLMEKVAPKKGPASCVNLLV